jgi:hypothetical protein
VVCRHKLVVGNSGSVRLRKHGTIPLKVWPSSEMGLAFWG